MPNERPWDPFSPNVDDEPGLTGTDPTHEDHVAFIASELEAGLAR